MPVRIVIADDHELILEAVRIALGEADDIEVIGTASTGNEVLEVVGRLAPDVLLLDLRMPGMDGLSCLDELRDRHSAVKVVVLSAVEEPQLIAEALKRGASSYVVKTVDPRDLAAAIRQAVEGTVYTGGGVLAVQSAGDTELGRLTAKEQAVLRALAQGHSNREIARELWLAEQTVKFHLTNIYKKLEVANRTEAARWAYRHGLAKPERVERG
ncbi:MAG TPA: response regulator transcription factor [Gaiellaceae bacterium]